MADVELLPSSVAAFAEALNGERGSLDAWLEVNNEREVAAHVEAYTRANLAPLQAENERLRAEVERLKSENARIREALQAIVDEVSDGLVPYSSDSYLPAHLVEQARAVLSKENSND